MLLPYPGAAGLMMANGNKLPQNWATTYLNKGQFGGIDLSYAYSVFNGKITQGSDGTFAFSKNVGGVNDGSGGNPFPSLIYNETRNGRTYLILKNLRIRGNLAGGGTNTQDRSSLPGIELINCKVEPWNAPAMTTGDPTTDQSFLAANGGLRGISTKLVNSVPVGATSITVKDQGPMETLVAGVTGYIGPNNSVPDSFSFTGPIVQNGDGTWTISGCSGIDGNAGAAWAAGTQVKFGCDRDSGRVTLDNVILGSWSDLWLYYGGDGNGDAPCIDFTNAQPENVGDVFLNRWYAQYFANDAMRFSGNDRPCKNIRFAHWSAHMHPGAWDASNVHGDMIRVKQLDNSALNAKTQPFAEWGNLAAIKGNAGFYINDPRYSTDPSDADPTAPAPTILNLGVKHCLFSCVNKMLQLADNAEATGVYFGYSWVAQNADFGDSVDMSNFGTMDFTCEEVRRDDNNGADPKCWSQSGTVCCGSGADDSPQGSNAGATLNVDDRLAGYGLSIADSTG